jgi:predicted nucleotidyltransferase|tara:strand:+ start:1049 stop:1186 length:138 start_codon:yes stop_codon:yes gene_type:complete
MWNKLLEWLGFVWVRQRDEKGQYKADNKKTKHKNEAWKRVYRRKK